MKRVVGITGIGTLTPAGRGTEALWTCISTGRSCLGSIDPQQYFDPSRFACQVAGQVPSFREPRVLTGEMLKQTDRCSRLALVAVLDALEMARLPTDFRSPGSPIAAERVALTVATIGAGWSYVEREMMHLWTQGVGAMDRYGLTAGFPAGPQGHISIFFGVEGRTRTFISERASGAHALIEGAKAIQRGDAEVVIAGGTEAPLTPLSWAAYQPMLQPTAQPNHSTGTGMLLGEGSTFLVLEEAEHARRRGVPLLAELRGWGSHTDPSSSSGRGLSQAIHMSLAQAGIHPTAVTLLFPAGPALLQEDMAEVVAINSVFEESLPSILTPKAVLGHLLGAATATDVAIAVVAMRRQTILGVSTDLPRHALILAGGGGMSVCFLVSQPERGKLSSSRTY